MRPPSRRPVVRRTGDRQGCLGVLTRAKRFAARRGERPLVVTPVASRRSSVHGLQRESGNVQNVGPGSCDACTRTCRGFRRCVCGPCCRAPSSSATACDHSPHADGRSGRHFCDALVVILCVLGGEGPIAIIRPTAFNRGGARNPEGSVIFIHPYSSSRTAASRLKSCDVVKVY